MKKFAILILLLSAIFLNVASKSFASFDALDRDQSFFITLGDFSFKDPIEELDDEIVDSFKEDFGYDTEEELYEDPVFQEIMVQASQTTTGGGGNSNLTYTVSGIGLSGLRWNVLGESSSRPGNTSLGLLRKIDRSLNDTLVPVHRVMPPLPGTNEAQYDGYNFFTAYDIKNTLTDNRFSFRLENVVTITTETPVASLEAIEFYAIRGLRTSNDGDNLGNRNFTISISSDGVNFTPLGSAISQSPTPLIYSENDLNGMAFPKYAFNLTQAQIDNQPTEGYYIRVFFNGALEGNGGNASRSRLVIDDFKVIKN